MKRLRRLCTAGIVIDTAVGLAFAAAFLLLLSVAL